MPRQNTPYENMRFKKKLGIGKTIARTFLAGAVSGAISLGVMQGFSGCKDKGLEKKVNEPNAIVQEVGTEDVNETDYVIDKPKIIDYEDLYNSLIKHEGIRDTAYLDSVGVLTIGIGFNLEKQGAQERIEKLGLNYDLVCDKKQKLSNEHIYSLMKEDIENSIFDAKKYVGDSWDNLDSDAKEIIINMSYNLGYPRLSGFKKLKQALISQDYETASKEMKDSKWYHQVGNRSKELVEKMNKIN